MTTPSPTRKVLELTVVCANMAKGCPRLGAPFTVTGHSRTRALKRGRAYCSLECGKAGRRANVSAAMKSRWANPRARARMMAARHGARQKAIANSQARVVNLRKLGPGAPEC